jgi:hypothetical protein
MLPPGHIAGGYLVSRVLQKLVPYSFTNKQKKWLSAAGAFFGFMPDLDFFYAFFKIKSFTIDVHEIDHRTFITHTPLPWLVLGLLIFASAKKPFTKAMGLMLWLGTWSHFALDSIEHGVRWLWPLNSNLYSVTSVSERIEHTGGFWSFWWNVVLWYGHNSVTFYFEILIIIIAFYIFYRSNKSFFAK